MIAERRRSRHRLGRRRRSLLLHRRRAASSSTATSSPRCSRSWSSARSPAPTILYDVRASSAPSPTRSRAHGRHARTSTGSATRSSSARCASTALPSRGEVSGHYYFRDFYNADTRHDPGAARARVAQPGGPVALGSWSAICAPSTSSPARSTPRSPIPRGRWPRSRRPIPTPRSPGSTASRSTTRTGTSTCGPSNTEPLLRLNLESLVSEADMATKRDRVLELIRA